MASKNKKGGCHVKRINNPPGDPPTAAVRAGSSVRAGVALMLVAGCPGRPVPQAAEAIRAGHMLAG